MSGAIPPLSNMPSGHAVKKSIGTTLHLPFTYITMMMTMTMMMMMMMMMRRRRRRRRRVVVVVVVVVISSLFHDKFIH
jgi:formate-dependent nitrite reductase membrane component NrfD